MEGEMNNFIQVWTLVFVSLCYCYFTGKIVPKGSLRLLSLLPIVALFLLLPLHLSSMHLVGTTGFFVAWLANFKLLLFAFGCGPLAADSFISLARFVTLACLPIKIRQEGGKKPQSRPQNAEKGHKSLLNYSVKALLLALFVRVYDYSDRFHPKLLQVLYGFHIYFSLEIILAFAAAIARAALGLELEPQFDEPYLATSLQDFWGRRWNVMVTSILRPTVYEPVLAASARVMGRRWATLPAVLGTFFVSAMMHELIFYYLGRVRPTWEITWFFMLHGISLVVEITLKKKFTGVWRLPRLVSRLLTVAFVMVTGLWLFFPQLLRCKADVRAMEEYAAVGAFVRNVGHGFNISSVISVGK